MIVQQKSVGGKKVNVSLDTLRNQILDYIQTQLDNPTLVSTLNINADHAAAKIAACLKAEKLIILTDVEGIIDNKNKLISSINKKNINKLIKGGVIQKGMVPKVKNMIDALSDGVSKAHIIDGRIKNAIILEMFTDSGIGTEILLWGKIVK